MTNPSEVVVSDEEFADFEEQYLMAENPRAVLAAFLAKRVPDAADARGLGKSDTLAAMDAGFNACRERVLKGE